ncbi:MAG: 1-acyl-sn-glycerol-3-phosphate acyltransferase [Candidatus Obscuribacterales bacterium]|nr:1-acyl-sn-glycerol-3-phosphate acyltransferase [Candidatus Obscuribacterales bacterium]
MLDFRAPLDNSLIIGGAKLLLPEILRVRMADAEIKVIGDGVDRFKELAGKRTVLCPNHSNRHDPEVMLALSSMVKEDFNFIAAREVFDWNHGLNGWFLQRMGCYSVVRGAVDRESFKTTKRLLVEGKKKLVLFPEGEISKQNDVLLPLESGVAQLGFMALDELQKIKPDEPLFILPIAIKYTYKGDLTHYLPELLQKIESHLGIKCDTADTIYQRVRNAAQVVLKTLEDEYNLHPKPETSLDERINGLKSQALKIIAEYLDVDLPADGRHLEWVRILRNTMDDYIYADHDSLPPYQRQIHEEKSEKIRGFYKDLDRVVNFIAIYDGYLAPPISQERMLSVLELIEIEVFGNAKIKGPRLILIDIGNPIDLLSVFSEYKKHKRTVIEKICLEISSQLISRLCEIDRQRTPVYVN